jgi:L-2-hydroxyglutarate oxidase LhgO
VSELETIALRGRTNGAPGLRLIDRAELYRLEPNVKGEAALLSLSSGILDSHGLVKALEARARAAGATILYRCELTAIDHNPTTGYTLRLTNPSGDEQLRVPRLVNCAGLAAGRISAMAGVDRYQIYPCKGDYFAVTGPAAQLVRHLVYPVPLPQLRSLGIHVTPDLAGRLRLGPDATYTNNTDDLEVARAKAVQFHAAISRFLPDLPLLALQPDTAGIRPKIQPPGGPWRDFVIRHEESHGAPGLINLIGIESPGLTAALAIADEVARLLPRDSP